MNEVEAVTDLEQVKLVPVLLEKHYNEQLANLWVLGVNVALRITDLLNLKWSDITHDKIEIKEGKTSKTAIVKLNDNAQRALAVLKRICKENDCDIKGGFVFPSVYSRNSKGDKPITRQGVANAFKEVGGILGVKLSTHSMRKTRGYHLYKKSHDIGAVMRVLRHSNEAVTLRYIGITQEAIDNSFDDLNL